MATIALPKAQTGDPPGRVLRLWLIGILVLLPIELGKLPLNVDVADAWIVMGLPIIWAFLLRGQRLIALSYALPIWVIMLSSIVSALGAANPVISVVVIVKESFLFIWFLTMAALLAILPEDALRRVLAVWLAVAFAHGLVIVAQFLSPAVWRFVSGLARRSTAAANYRPTGLFANANKAAMFQLCAFVPLILVRPPRRLGMVLGVILLGMMLATGSMGAAVALAAGLAASLVAVAWTADLGHTLRMLAQLALVVALIGGLVLLVIGQSPRYQEHLQRILLGRTDRSSGSRFSLWERGLSIFTAQGTFVWGIGPENFRVVDGHGNQLHSDILAFAVERGALGALGLVAFVGLAASRAILVVRAYLRHPERGHLGLVVFVGAVVAAVVESLTHQAFRFHDLWLILALQEATLHRMTRA